MTFSVGQKVVCVDNTTTREDVNMPELRRVYVIRWIGQRGSDSDIGLMLEGHFAGLSPHWGVEFCFEPSRFRPIANFKSEISFTQGAPKDSKRFDNRRKIKERA